MSKKVYTLEFKQEAVKLIREQGYSQSEVSSRLGVPHANLSRWLKELSGTLSKGRLETKSQKTAEQKELEELRKENKRLKMERDILKKAATFFANESN